MSFIDLLPVHSPWSADPGVRPTRALFPKRRALFGPLLEALTAPGVPRAQLLLGPRQVGKSVLLRQLADQLLDSIPARNVVYFDFSDERILGTRSIRDLVDASTPGRDRASPSFFLLDEATRAARWSESLKQLVDRSRQSPDHAGERFLLTDSAASVLWKGAEESLEGRVDQHELEGLTFSEYLALAASRTDPNPEAGAALIEADPYLAVGGFPAHRFAELTLARERIRADLCDRAIGRDLSRRGLDTDRVVKLFVALVQDSGAIFTAARRAKAVDAGLGSQGTDARTVAEWVRLLQQMKLIAVLPKLGPVRGGPRAYGNLTLRTQPRVYAADHGVVCAFSPHSDPTSIPEWKGRVLECAVFRHLREIGRARTDTGLSFYRDKDQYELDFVLEMGARRLGIQVTAGSDPWTGSRRAGEAARRAEVDRLLILHGGNEAQQKGTVAVLPWWRFLLEPTAVVEGCLQ